ncbi:hypothetical protein BY996DRAFT_21484 [Phakopsora pachyrhizi]|nr:hypothetical protein BY996DRAFT_21484 [Phakopsora pachyrhizi]
MVIKQAPTLNCLRPLDDQLHFLKFFGPSSALQTPTAAQPLLNNNKQPILSQKQLSLINQHNQQQSRLIKLLDCVKHEFDSLNFEAQHLKSQSSKVESHITACIANLNQLREQFIQLDREHQKLKTK